MSRLNLKKLSVKKAGMKKLFLTLYLPFIFFITFDVISTYYGVCIMHGFEMNEVALWLTPKIGYLGFSAFLYVFYAAIIAVLTWYIHTFRNNDICLFVLLFFWSIMLLNYARVILVNSNALIYHATHKPIMPAETTRKIVGIPTQEIVKRAEVFKEVKKDFCRLV